MDGVLADFVSAALKVHNFPADRYNPAGDYHMEKQLGISEKTFWNRIDLAGEEFWSNMGAFSYTKDLINLVDNLDKWMILSAPSRNPQCLSGKMKWLQKQFGSKFNKYIFCPAKFKHLLADEKSILIDDSDRNCAQWDSHLAILFPQRWNANHLLAGDPMGYTKKKIKEIDW